MQPLCPQCQTALVQQGCPQCRDVKGFARHYLAANAGYRIKPVEIEVGASLLAELLRHGLYDARWPLEDGFAFGYIKWPDQGRARPICCIHADFSGGRAPGVNGKLILVGIIEWPDQPGRPIQYRKFGAGQVGMARDFVRDVIFDTQKARLSCEV